MNNDLYIKEVLLLIKHYPTTDFAIPLCIYNEIKNDFFLKKDHIWYHDLNGFDCTTIEYRHYGGKWKRISIDNAFKYITREICLLPFT
jgi:hypothetical protein